MALRIRPMKGCDAISIRRDKSLVVLGTAHARAAVDLVEAAEALVNEVEAEPHGEEASHLGDTSTDEREPS